MQDIKIIYEDNDILAVNKPAGLLVHGPDSLVDWLVKKYPEIKNVGDEPELRPGIVHRLDKDTSGILLVAKNQRSFEFLKNQFQERKIKKKYIALIEGNINPLVGGNNGIINLPIGKSKTDFRKKVAGRKTDNKAREAITEYKTLKNIKNQTSGKGYTLIEAYPKTGRTHQIRVHFKALGHPVVCDRLYGKKETECPFGLKRHFLHARSLEFDLPSGGIIKLESDLPEDLQNTLNMLD